MSLAATGSGYRCERESYWGQTEYFNCPEQGKNTRDEIYCCGFGDNKYCCSKPTDEELIEDFFENLPTILGVIAAIIITLIVLCIVCCCCCPFCLLHKRRNRGTVHNPNPEVSVMQPLQTQPQPYAQQPYPGVPPQQAPYPTQPMGMQAAPAPYPPQQYPPAGYPGEQPPMYTEKQPPPYNPTY